MGKKQTKKNIYIYVHGYPYNLKKTDFNYLSQKNNPKQP